MKLNLITHNTRGLNDPEIIIKERKNLSLFSPKQDVVLVHAHKLRGRLLEFTT